MKHLTWASIPRLRLLIGCSLSDAFQEAISVAAALDSRVYVEINNRCTVCVYPTSSAKNLVEEATEASK